MEHEFTQDSIILSVQADAKNYIFSYQSPGGELVTIGIGECFLLSTEVAGGFTGGFFGLYATGNGRDSKNPVYFDWFEYRL